MKDMQLLHICLDYCTRNEKVRTELDKSDFQKLRSSDVLSKEKIGDSKFSNLRNILLHGTESDIKKIELENKSFYTVWNNRDKPNNRDPEKIIEILLSIIDEESREIDVLMRIIFELKNKFLVSEGEFSQYIKILNRKCSIDLNFYKYKQLILKKYDLYYCSSTNKLRRII